MNPEISAGAGALLSLLLKRAVMALLLGVVAAGMAVWNCTDPAAGETAACLGGPVWRQAAKAFLYALMANQATDRLSPKPRGAA